MRVTKTQLRRIIREVRSSLREQPVPTTPSRLSRPSADPYDRLERAIGAAMDELGEQQVRDYLKAFVEGY
jgi:hypothetical protein